MLIIIKTKFSNNFKLFQVIGTNETFRYFINTNFGTFARPLELYQFIFRSNWIFLNLIILLNSFHLKYTQTFYIIFNYLIKSVNRLSRRNFNIIQIFRWLFLDWNYHIISLPFFVFPQIYKTMYHMIQLLRALGHRAMTSHWNSFKESFYHCLKNSKQKMNLISYCSDNKTNDWYVKSFI